MPFIAAGALQTRSTPSSTKGWIFVSCLTNIFRLADVRVRPVPELRTCIVYTPHKPQLYTLNPHAWLVLELAPGRTYAELSERYIAATVPPLTKPLAERHLVEAISMLSKTGILLQSPADVEVVQ
jgi:hypothetical protein